MFASPSSSQFFSPSSILSIIDNILKIYNMLTHPTNFITPWTVLRYKKVFFKNQFSDWIGWIGTILIISRHHRVESNPKDS